MSILCHHPLSPAQQHDVTTMFRLPLTISARQTTAIFVPLAFVVVLRPHLPDRLLVTMFHECSLLKREPDGIKTAKHSCSA